MPNNYEITLDDINNTIDNINKKFKKGNKMKKRKGEIPEEKSTDEEFTTTIDEFDGDGKKSDFRKKIEIVKEYWSFIFSLLTLITLPFIVNPNSGWFLIATSLIHFNLLFLSTYQISIKRKF